MEKKLTGLTAGGLAHPEIRQGDKWRDIWQDMGASLAGNEGVFHA